MTSPLDHLRPWPGRILARRHKPKEVSPGGLAIPEKSQETIHGGVVVSVGPSPDTKVWPAGLLSPGDTIWWKDFSGSDLTVTDEEIIVVLDYYDVLAVEPKE
jgi:chaperonin GroES